jgi:RimJ/RimL family protein N-acetyltransferase
MDAGISETLERVVQLANPLLRRVPRYSERLAPAVRNAMGHAHDLVADIAPAREAGAITGASHDVDEVLDRSPEVQAWFTANPAAREVWAVLSMQSAPGGFTDYRARICAGTEHELRREVERRIVDQLALTAIAAASRHESKHAVLEQERDLLRTRLKLLEADGAGVSGLGIRSSPRLGEVVRVRMELAGNEARLEELAASSDDLEPELQQLLVVLADPAPHFSLSPRRIGALNLQVACVPVVGGGPEVRAFLLVRYKRSNVPRDGGLRVMLRDGRHVTIREVQAEDADAFGAAFAQLSAETRYNRFMGAVGVLPAAVLERAVNPLAENELALVAVHGNGSNTLIVGGARYFVEADGETCEFAVTVVDDWQRHGLASHLMQALMREARLRGLRRLHGFVLAGNVAMLALARRLGFEITASAVDPGVRIVATRVS